MLGLGTFLSRTLSRVLKDCKSRPDSSNAIKHRLPCLVRAMRPGRVFGPGKPLFDLPHFQNISMLGCLQATNLVELFFDR